MMYFRHVRVLLLLALLHPAAVFAQTPAPQETAEVTVRRGDEVEIEVFGRSELSVKRIVDREGAIQLPYLGAVTVTGLSPEAIRQAIAQRYGTLYASPLVNVEVLVGVNVTGEVARADRYRVDPSATLLDIIALAGGITDEGRKSQVELVRDGELRVFNMTDPRDAALMLATPVQSGDWIRVPRKLITAQESYWLFGALNFLATLTLYFVR